MAEFVVEFEAIDNAFGTEFEGFTQVSDGGFERGYQDGYADALSKRTDLVVTENGEYAPSEGSTGFKNVKVDIAFRSPFDDYVEGNTTELSSGASKIADGAFKELKTLTSANFPNATSVGAQAFYNCPALKSVSVPNATSIGVQAFNSCSELTDINYPNATSIGEYAFSNCKKITVANFPNATSVGEYAFNSCNKLTTVNFPNVTSLSNSALYSCKSLAYVLLPKIATLQSSTLQICESLEIVDLPKLSSFNGSYQLAACYSLKAVILRSTERVCSLSSTNAFSGCYHIHGTVNSTYNPNGDKDCYIYVPRALLSDDDAKKDYRRATNWSTFATQFRALEDYTVDGTTTGELDPNKI